MKAYTITLLFAAAALMMASCAKEPENDTTDARQKRILEAFVEKYNEEHGTNVVPEESGLVILDHKVGQGMPAANATALYAYYEEMTLDGIYSWVSDEDKCKELGQYDVRDYYGPTIFMLRKNSQTRGMEELLWSVNQGSEIDAIIPPWLTNIVTDNSYSDDEYSVNMRYKFKITDVITDMAQYQIDTIASYMRKYYPGTDSTKYGFYFKKLHDAGKDTIESSTEVSCRYIGRLLDGYVFDTNIADSARKFGIFDSETDYSEGLSVIYDETYKGMTSSSLSSNGTATSGGVCEGFARALKMMSYGDEAIAVFWSDMGYGENGNTDGRQGVPAYQPLAFYIYVEPEEED